MKTGAETKHNRVALIQAPEPTPYTKAVERIIRVLCGMIHTDVDFVLYRKARKIDPVKASCPECAQSFYVRGSLYNDEHVQCPGCDREYIVFTGLTAARLREVLKGEK